LQQVHIYQIAAILVLAMMVVVRVAEIIHILVVHRVVQPVYHQVRRLRWLMLLVEGRPE